ncbi:hypothetical protein CATRI_08670 [Corynebacterium atrinae]|uniref:YggS family pyridoxal phosphate-dependent enzyme n=1 Tax=Corynebacterium atrinae TaxID=1336740 RepID=UPI0025B53F91|nr:YggS family pyridoxal phosphate-dependent enzyme [Corynebacterium atrinae]WJY63806.1 hypothetical protein CATRI_08670 [Corynebacterium atrinae]
MTGDARTEELRVNLSALTKRIDAAVAAAGRTPGDVRLLPVTKFHPAEDVARLATLGVTDVGENREQEAREKAAAVPQVRFHMIGQIQTKKANAVARWAAGVQSLDSVRLAEALDRGMALALERGDRSSALLPCHLQLSADGDTARGGVGEKDLAELAAAVEAAGHLHLTGLMVVPPLGSSAAEVFSWARKLCDDLAQRYGRPMDLSAGMSADLEEAIIAGTNMVRVGTGVLGKRPVA